MKRYYVYVKTNDWIDPIRADMGELGKDMTDVFVMSKNIISVELPEDVIIFLSLKYPGTIFNEISQGLLDILASAKGDSNSPTKLFNVAPSPSYTNTYTSMKLEEGRN